MKMNSEILLHTAIAQCANEVAKAHKTLVTTALKISQATTDSTGACNAMAVSNYSYYQAISASQISDMHILEARTKIDLKRKRDSESDTDETISF